MVSAPFTRVEPLLILCAEIAGTGGAFASSSAISRWGNNYSFFLTPIFFAIAGLIWIFISVLNFDYNVGADEELEQAGLSNVERSKQPSTNYLILVFRGFLNFAESIWVGAKLIFTNRCFICELPIFLGVAKCLTKWARTGLLPSYSIALYLHRFLENSLAPAFAKRVLGTSAWSQIVVGGSNFGEVRSVLHTEEY